MPPPPTARLTFRRWTAEDADLASALWGDPAVTAFVAAEPLTPDAIATRLAAEMALDREHGVQYWPIFLRDGGAFVGCCGLRPYRPAQGVLELGVHLRSRYWGHGYAAEAARAVIAHAFADLGATALFAGHHPDNARSRMLLERLGFRYTHDEPYPPTGRQHPSYLLRPADRPLPDTVHPQGN